MGYVYCLHDFTNDMCRIGKTKSHKTGRIRSQTGYYPFELVTVSEFFLNEDKAEKHFHSIFKDKNIRADWFRITPKDFEEEVKKYKTANGEIYVQSKAVGVNSKGTVKYWRVLSDKGEYKCDFVHINFDKWVLKLKCNDKFVELQFTKLESYREAKNGTWVKAFASRNRSFKMVKVRFI